MEALKSFHQKRHPSINPAFQYPSSTVKVFERFSISRLKGNSTFFSSATIPGFVSRVFLSLRVLMKFKWASKALWCLRLSAKTSFLSHRMERRPENKENINFCLWRLREEKRWKSSEVFVLFGWERASCVAWVMRKFDISIWLILNLYTPQAPSQLIFHSQKPFKPIWFSHLGLTTTSPKVDTLERIK